MDDLIGSPWHPPWIGRSSVHRCNPVRVRQIFRDAASFPRHCHLRCRCPRYFPKNRWDWPTVRSPRQRWNNETRFDSVQQFIQRFLVAEIIPFHVADRDGQHFSLRTGVGKGSEGILHPHLHRLANIFQSLRSASVPPAAVLIRKGSGSHCKFPTPVLHRPQIDALIPSPEKISQWRPSSDSLQTRIRQGR